MKKLAKAGVVLMCSGFISLAHAASYDKAESVQSQTNTDSTNSQKRIDDSAEISAQTRADIEQLQAEITNLTIYQSHLDKMVQSQNQEKSSLQEQLEQIQATRQGIVPLMYKMLDELEQQVQQGLPIRRETRLQRVEKLRTLMTRADVSDAEKFRRLLEAYQIELSYGGKMGRYDDQITLADGKKIEASLVYLGKVSLLARSLDQQKYWRWDQSQQQWQSLDSGFDAIDSAFDVADKNTTPTLLALPLSLPLNEEEK